MTSGTSHQPSTSRKVPVPGKTKNRNDLRKEVLARLQLLRTVSREVSRSYLADLEREIVDLTDAVSAGGTAGERKRLHPKMLERIMDVLNDLNVKPEKGKRKGLKKIEEAVKTMSNMVSRG